MPVTILTGVYTNSHVCRTYRPSHYFHTTQNRLFFFRLSRFFSSSPFHYSTFLFLWRSVIRPLPRLCSASTLFVFVSSSFTIRAETNMPWEIIVGAIFKFGKVQKKTSRMSKNPVVIPATSSWFFFMLKKLFFLVDTRWASMALKYEDRKKEISNKMAALSPTPDQAHLTKIRERRWHVSRILSRSIVEWIENEARRDNDG